APPELKARVPKLNELLTDVRSHVALVAIHSNVNGARVMLRGKYVATTPVRWAVATAGGKAALEVTAEGFTPYAREILLEEGRLTPVEANLAPSSALAP